MNFEYKDYELSNAITDIAAGPFGSNLKVSCFTTTGFPIIDGANLKEITVTDNITKFVPEDKARSLHRSIAKRRDVVVTISGNVGQVSYIPDNSQYAEYLCSQRQFRVTFDESKIYVPYLVYYLHSVEGQSKILAFANQTGVPALSQPLKNFRKIKIDLPSLAEQKKIAAILSALDEKIAINREINDNLQKQAAALFESWFVDYNPWSGIQPSEWTNAPLGTFVEIKRGGSPRPIQDYLSDSGLRWLKISDVTSLSSPFVLEIKEHIKEEGLKKTVFLHAGELVLSNSATPGIPKILDVDTCIHDGWLYFPKSELSKYYLYLFFKHIRKELVSLGNGSVFTNLKTDILKAFPATKADKVTLKKFDALVSPLFDAMLNADRENLKLATMRDSLLPKLMSGEIDVSSVQF